MGEKELERLFCQKIQALEKHFTSELAARDKAEQLQHKEYERRLDFLNGEAERLRQMQATYLPREVFEKINDAKDETIKDIRGEIKDLQSFKNTQIGRQLITTAGVSVAIAAVVSFIIRSIG